jgi:hypothetical protein
MRWFFLLPTVTFVGTILAVVVSRASMEGSSFLLGLVGGIAASVPASILAFILANRTGGAAKSDHSAQQPYQPLVIVNGGGLPRPQPPLPDLPLPAPGPVDTPRYRIIGEE